MKPFLDYSWKVLRRWRAALTVIPSLVGTVLTFTGVHFLFPSWLWTVILILSLHYAGFVVYSDLLETLPGPADVRIRQRTVTFGGHGWQNRMPTLPARFIVELEISNRGHQEATLDTPRPTQYEVGVSFLGEAPTGYTLQHREAGARPIALTFPVRIPSPSLDPHYILEIRVPFQPSSPEELARSLRDMNEFTISFDFPVRAVSGEEGTARLAVAGSFQGFREAVVDHWTTTNDHQLLVLSGQRE